MVKLSFSKGDFVWISLVIVLIGVGFVVSIGSDNYLVHGHDSGELDVSGGGLAFGSWVDLTSSYVLDSSVTATTDGFVVLYADPNADDIIGYTGACGSETAVLRNLHRSVGTWGGLTMPVKSGDCWKITADGTAGDIDVLHWIPIVGVTPDTAGFDPVSYAGEDTITYPNGVIMKSGYTTSTSVTFSPSFPTATTNVMLSPVIPSVTSWDYDSGILDGSVSKNGFQIKVRLPARYSGWYWTATGY